LKSSSTSAKLRKLPLSNPRPLFEHLEGRQLMAGDATIIQTTPFALEFDKYGGIIKDKDSQATGFTWVAPNTFANEYQKGLIDLRTGAGILKLISSGDNYESSNNLANALQTQFNATSEFRISVTLRGPLNTINVNGQGAGVLWGIDQSNFVRLAVVKTAQGEGIQFIDEQKFATGMRHALVNAPIFNIGSLAAVNSLELVIAGNPVAGRVTAYYRVNGGDLYQFPASFLLKADKKKAFFSAASKAGIIAFNSAGAPSHSIAFERFAIDKGVPVVGAPKLLMDTATRRYLDVRGGAASAEQQITITNPGTLPLIIYSLGLTGEHADQFSITNPQSVPLSIAPGASINIGVVFNPTSGTSNGIKTAALTVVSNAGTASSKVRGLATAGFGGANEPSLQRVFDLYEIPLNVGDDNPNDTFLPANPLQPNDEVVMQTLKKAGTGQITIEPLAVFGVGSATRPTTRFGYYTPGSQFDRHELLTVMGTGAATQTITPQINGVTSFEPGSKDFSLYMQFPSMYPAVVSNPDGTIAYSEDALNKTYDPSVPRKLRFYPLKNSDGTVVENAYIVVGEDLNAAYDTQDFVAILRNVTVGSTGAEIGFENIDGGNYADRLVFNRIQFPDNVDPTPDNVVHDTAKIRIRNSGTEMLNVTSMTIPYQWQLVDAPPSFSLAPGAFLDLTVKFIVTSSGSDTNVNMGTHFGDLVLHTNDSDEAAAKIQLAGFWQKYSEKDMEPSLIQLMQLFGFTTKILNDGQSLNQGGLVASVGEEVLSRFWLRADSTLPVTVTQLAAYHTQGQTAVFKWYPQGSSTRNVLFTHDGDDGQSLMPHQLDSSALCYATFNPTGPFALKVDGEGTDDPTNVGEVNDGNHGHHIRMFPARDREGNIIPNTYLMCLDYAGINYDYQDNVYLVTNIMPSNT
jgi:hypothetical protein